MLFVKKNILRAYYLQSIFPLGHTQFTLRGVYLSFVCLSCRVFVDVHSVFLMARL